MIDDDPTAEERPKPRKRPAVDPGCYDLAEHFMQDENDPNEDETWQLAARIQQAVEDWLEERHAYRGRR